MRLWWCATAISFNAACWAWCYRTILRRHVPDNFVSAVPFILQRGYLLSISGWFGLAPLLCIRTTPLTVVSAGTKLLPYCMLGSCMFACLNSCIRSSYWLSRYGYADDMILVRLRILLNLGGCPFYHCSVSLLRFSNRLPYRATPFGFAALLLLYRACNAAACVNVPGRWFRCRGLLAAVAAGCGFSLLAAGREKLLSWRGPSLYQQRRMVC